MLAYCHCVNIVNIAVIVCKCHCCYGYMLLLCVNIIAAMCRIWLAATVCKCCCASNVCECWLAVTVCKCFRCCVSMLLLPDCFKHNISAFNNLFHHKDCLNALKKLDRTFVAGRDITPNITNTVLFIIITI